jgi:hypothetical protein
MGGIPGLQRTSSLRYVLRCARERTLEWFETDLKAYVAKLSCAIYVKP